MNLRLNRIYSLIMWTQNEPGTHCSTPRTEEHSPHDCFGLPFFSFVLSEEIVPDVSNLEYGHFLPMQTETLLHIVLGFLKRQPKKQFIYLFDVPMVSWKYLFWVCNNSFADAYFWYVITLANYCLHPHNIYQIYQLVFSPTVATQVQATHYHLLPGPL